MSPIDQDGWRKADQLFDQVLALPVDERQSFLNRADVSDESRERVQRLLRAYEKAPDAIGESAAPLARMLIPAQDEFPPGSELGPYRVMRELGRGGMGTVYLAERSDDRYARQVAIKVVKRGMDTDEILMRSYRERHILARLEHPGIGRMYDAGVTSDGRPYLVLEYIDGQPIDDYCDGQQLTVEGRLRLFLCVCDAVSYAHQKLVLHRDLKPSNILVAEDGPKVVDFGIGKILDDAGDGAAELTAMSGRRLTPEYASPEQLTGDPVSTASDVYSLGVVLYELLTSTRPHQGTLRRASTSLTDPDRNNDENTRAAASRRSTPERLARRLRGDLDVILMKALHADIDRRYPSVEAFAQDLTRHVDGFPVTARADSLSYRLGKFVNRHRIPVFSGSGLVLSFLFFGIASTVQQVQTARERDRADRERDRAEEVAGVLEDMFTGAGFGSIARVDTLTVRQFLDQSADGVIEELGDQPIVQGTLLRILASAHVAYGRMDEADSLLTRSVKVLESAESLAAEDPRPLSATNRGLAWLRIRQGRFEEARSLLAGALEDESWRSVEDKADAFHNMGIVYVSLGQMDSAKIMLDTAVALRAEDVEGDRMSYAESLSMRAGVAQRMGDLDLAGTRAKEAWDVSRESLGPDHPRVFTMEHNHAFMIYRSGRPEEAEPLFQSLVKRYRRVVGETPDFASVLMSYGNVLRDTGSLERSLATIEEAIAIQKELLGDRNPALVFSLDGLGTTLAAMERYPEALEVFHEQLTLSLEALGREHPGTAVAYGKVADALCVLPNRRAADVVSRMEDAELAILAAFPEGHPATTDLLVRKGRCYLRLERWGGAAEALERAIRLMEQRGASGPQIESARNLLVQAQAR